MQSAAPTKHNIFRFLGGREGEGGRKCAYSNAQKKRRGGEVAAVKITEGEVKFSIS